MLNRRLLMAHGTPEKEWGIDWEYTDGDLTDFGWAKSANGGESGLQADGLKITTKPAVWAFIQYVPPIRYCKKGIIECTFEISQMGNIDPWGFRVAFGNRNNTGCQVLIRKGEMFYDQMGTQISLSSIELNKEYTVRLEYDDGIRNAVFLDDVKIYETNQMSNYGLGESKVLQHGSGTTLLKSIRCNFPEV